MLQAARRLPGIRFEAQPPPPAVVLPRMDVAGFVGYASSGPLDVPVAVEDVVQFAEVFGSDLPVAWDARRGEVAYASLGPAVRSFFRNGGRRCFVVRVADEGARATSFQLPGLVAVAPEGPRHAMLRARSEGTWPDEMWVAVSVASSPLVVRPVSLRTGTFEVLSPGVGVLRPGDLIRLRFPGGWTLMVTLAAAAVATRSAQMWSQDEPERTVVARIAADELLWSQPASLSPGDAHPARWIGPRGIPRVAEAQVVGPTRVRLAADLARAPAQGALVALGATRPEIWAAVEDRQPHRDGTVLAVQAVRLQRTAPPGMHRSRGRRAAERVELEVWTEDGGSRIRLGDLGFGRLHPRFLGDLPTDEALYAMAPRGFQGQEPELWRSARRPRFPLAGPVHPPRAYFPVTASIIASPWLGALPSAGSRQRRNGLERFRSSVFIDSRLEAVRAPALMAQADSVLYGTGAADSEQLHGLHALIGVDEVTLVAVPDAAQAGWSVNRAPEPGPPELVPYDEPEEGTFTACTSSALTPPELRLTGVPGTGNHGLAWETPPTGAEVEVEEAGDADFETAVALYRGERSELLLGSQPPGHRWYRARFVMGESTGPYSAIGPVGATPRQAAELRRPESYTDAVLVSVHRALLRLCGARGDVFALLAVPEHYREEAVIGHANALRTGRAWPRTDVPPLGEGEAFTLSSAAVHHPWLLVTSADQPGAVHRLPPDGATAGVLARRAAESGAWFAPANVALRDVVGLSPELRAERRMDLLEAHVNVVERTARGFMAMAADTLSTDPEARPVNVRRLLQLLRRLALRHGETYAFEPNGEALQRTAQRGFEAVLGALFRLDAFSGRRAEEGFQVVVSGPGSPTPGIDEEQLVVELRVAPSRPLAFLTVRLVRAGDGRLRVETI